MATQAQQNKDLVRRYCEHGIRQALRGNLGAVHDYLADHYVQHTASHTQHGRHGIDDHKASIEEAVKAIPDLCFAVDRYVAEGDYVVTHWRIEGTHTGRHKHRHSDQHLEGTDADADIQGMTLYRVEDGKIAESWLYDTHLDFLINAGALRVSS